MIAFGIDVVELDRAATLLRRSGDLLLGRVATPGEADWIGVDAERLAVVLAVKEGCIKAVGGRAPGFRWSDAALIREAGEVRENDETVSLLAGFERDAALEGVRRLGCRLTGASADALAPGTAALDGVACAGTAAGHVLVAVAFPLPAGARGPAGSRGPAGESGHERERILR